MVKKSRTRGWTLIEVMIVIAIAGIIFMLAPNILNSITRFSRLSDARVKTQENARLSLEEMNKALRQATASTVVISQETSQPPCSSITFTTIDSRMLKFYQSGDLLKFVNNGSTKTFSDGLRTLAFTYPRTDDDTILSVSVTFEKATYEGATKSLQMAIEKVRIMND